MEKGNTAIISDVIIHLSRIGRVHYTKVNHRNDTKYFSQYFCICQKSQICQQHGFKMYILGASSLGKTSITVAVQNCSASYTVGTNYLVTMTTSNSSTRTALAKT